MRRKAIQTQSRIRAWAAFAEQIYFHRAWIVQEISIAAKLLVYCGDRYLDWNTLVTKRRQRNGDFDGIQKGSLPADLGVVLQFDDVRTDHKAGAEVWLFIRARRKILRQRVRAATRQFFCSQLPGKAKQNSFRTTCQIRRSWLSRYWINDRQINSFYTTDSLFDLLDMNEDEEMERQT